MRFSFNTLRSTGLAMLLCVGSCMFAGCSSQKSWLYSVEPESDLPVLLDSSVAVPPFSDQRSNENSNMWAMYMVPLLPFGWQDFSAPEGAQMHISSGLWLWRPSEDLAKATAEELQASHIFREVFYTNRKSEGNLVLLGTIRGTGYAGRLFSYGLSVYGPLLWLVGFPAATTSNTLEVSFALKDEARNRVLWEQTYSEKSSNVAWIYVMGSDFNYAELYKKIMLQAVNDLRASLRTTE